MTPRTAASISAGLWIFQIGVLALTVWLVHEQLNSSNHVLYWAQVLSGNWSVDYLTNEKYGDQVAGASRRLEFTYGMVVSILLNIGTIVALATALRKIWHMRSAMNVYKAFSLKEDIIKRRVLAILSETDQYDLASKVREAFKAADKEWKSSALETFLSPDAQQKLQRVAQQELEDSGSRR